MELYGIVDGSARGIMTQNLIQIGVKWTVEVVCDSRTAVSISAESGVGSTRCIVTRRIWRQDVTMEKKIKLKKIDDGTKFADVGTTPLEPKRHQELMKQLPLAPPQCKRFLAVLAALSVTPAAADHDVVKGCAVKHYEMFGHTWTYVVVILVTVGCVRACDWVSGLARRQRLRSMASHTATTYTQVRRAAQPRFTVLAEYARG